MSNERIPVYGKGEQLRDWIHVFDNCAGILTVMNRGKNGEIYNIAAEQEYSNIEVVQLICNLMGKGHDLISFVPDRPGHDFCYGVRTEKLKTLDWKPEFRFKSGLESTISWFTNNKWFLNITT